MKSTHVRTVWVALCLVMIVIYVAVPADSFARTIVWWAIGLLSAAIVFWATVSRALWARLAWLLLASAEFTYVLGYVLGYVADPGRSTSLHIAADSPLAAPLTGVAYLLMIGSIFVIVHLRRRVHDTSGFLDAAIVFVVGLMVGIQFLIMPLLDDPSLPASARAALILFSLLNALLLAGAVRLWFASDPGVNRAIRLLSAGFFVLVAANALDLGARQFNAESISAITASGIGYLLFLGVTAAAALDPSAVRPPVVNAEAGVLARGRVLAVLAASILIPLALLLAVGVEDDFLHSPAFIAITLALAGLIALRVNLLINGFRDAVRRERVLRQINAALMRVTRREDIASGMDAWAGDLVEQDDATCRIGSAADLQALGIGPLSGRFTDGAGRARYRTVVSVPGTQPPRRMVVETGEALSSATAASLSVMGQSVGMTLERLALGRRLLEVRATERVELLLRNASDVIVLVDADGLMQYLTAAVSTIIDRHPPDLVSHHWAGLFEDPPLARAVLDRARQGDAARTDLALARDLQVNPDAGPRLVDVIARWLPEEQQYVITHYDITERHRLEQELKHRAFHDSLTGLSNRAVFREQLDRTATRARETGLPFTVLMLDLDDFKDVNDSLGHPAGDELLRTIAARLVDCLREGDTPVRLGGDEFAAILHSAETADRAVATAERVLANLIEPIILQGTEVVSRASIGVAVSDGSQDSAEIERDADIALYVAKNSGKGRVRVFEPSMRDEAVTRMELTGDLRAALSRSEINVQYQPIVDLATGRVAGFEALARWAHPTRGDLDPHVFIPLAEGSGLISEIGVFMMRTALTDLAHWQKQQPEQRALRVSLNLSGRHLADEDVAAQLQDEITRAGVDPATVVVEVTESVLVPQGESGDTQLRELAELGVSIYVDDFGTGWSSLHYLRALPVRGFKLAQEFVAGLPRAQDMGLVRAIRDMALSMGLEEVVVEGVALEDQRAALLSLGYRLGQGFLLAPPLTAAGVDVFLRTRECTAWSQDGFAAPLPPDQA